MQGAIDNSEIVGGLILALFALTVGNAAVIIVVVNLPSTYFLDRHGPSYCATRHPVLRWSLLVAKNLAGAVATLIGLVTVLPDVPGPGLLLILIGIMLVDFPGKRRLERKLLERPRVLHAVNSLRTRFGSPPLVLQDPSSESDPALGPGQ